MPAPSHNAGMANSRPPNGALAERTYLRSMAGDLDQHLKARARSTESARRS